MHLSLNWPQSLEIIFFLKFLTLGACVWEKLKLGKIQYPEAGFYLALVTQDLEARLLQGSLNPWAAVITLLSLPLAKVLGQVASVPHPYPMIKITDLHTAWHTGLGLSFGL